MTATPHSRSIFFIFLLLFLPTSCSPLYVIQASVEEARILLKRQDIQEIIGNPTTDESTRSKLSLVLETRDFAKSFGLIPKKSFTQYSHINRDVLVWVLSASPPDELTAITWWFPIVGSVPYKGFFSKKDALRAEQKFKHSGQDTFLRPSAAFSTLGWFNDPLLSTTLQLDEIALVDTVIHEILHNTLWVKNDAVFNESLATFVGAVGAIKFFEMKGEKYLLHTQAATRRWKWEIAYSRFLEELLDELRVFYTQHKQSNTNKAQIKELREVLFQNAQTRTPAANQMTLNNALLLAQATYLHRLDLFEQLFASCEHELSCFIQEMKQVEKLAEMEKLSPYSALKKHLTHLNLTLSQGE